MIQAEAPVLDWSVPSRRGRRRKWVRIALALVLVPLTAALIFLAVTWDDRYTSAAQVEIDRPPAEVYPYCTDEAKLRQWLEGLESIEPLTDQTEGEGAKFREVFVIEGERYELDVEVLEQVPNERLSILMTVPDMFESTITYTFTPNGSGGTRVDFQQETLYLHPLAKLFAPLASADCENHTDKALQRLKHVVEES